MPMDAANDEGVAPSNLATQPQSTLANANVVAQSDAAVTDGSSKRSITSSTTSSSGLDQAPCVRIDSPRSVSSPNIDSADRPLTPSLATTESHAPHTDTGLAADYESATAGHWNDAPSYMQARALHVGVGTAGQDNSTSHFPRGDPLTAANLQALEGIIPPMDSQDSSVGLWLANMGGVHPLDDARWARLVATDPLAADIEAATGVGHHNEANKNG